MTTNQRLPDFAGKLLGAVELKTTDPEQPTRPEVIASDLRIFAVWALRFLSLVAGAIILWKSFAAVWDGLLPVFLSIIVCTILWPPVRWMSQRGVPRILAVLLSIVGGVAIVTGVFVAIMPGVVNQSEQLTKQASTTLRDLQTRLNEPPFNIQDEQINKGIEQLANQIQNHSDDLISGVISGLSVASSIVITAVIVLMLTFFFLKDGDRFLPWLYRTIGPSNTGRHMVEVCERSWSTLGGFIRAQAIIALINSVFIGVGLSVLNVPLALALATLNFFMGFIPIFGAFFAGGVAVIIALVAVNPMTALLTGLLILAIHQIEGNVLSPILQSKAMHLHPVLILLSIAVGTSLYGIVGTFLAVPAAAVLAVIVRYVGEKIDEVVVDPASAKTPEETK